MTPIASSCAPGTADSRRLAWRRIGLGIINLAVWTAIIMGVRSCL